MKHTENCKAMLHRLACAVVACTVAVSFTAAAFAQTGDGSQQKTIVMEPTEAPQTNGLTAQQIAAGLGKARQYGVVANLLENNLDFETNIAVNTLTGSNGEIGNTHDVTYPSAASLTIHVYNAKAACQFGIFADAEAAQQIGENVTVGVDENGSGNTTVSSLEAGRTYYVMPYKDEKPDAEHAEKVTVPQTTDNLASGAVSYVGTVESSTGTLTLKSAGETKSKVVFGANNSLQGEGGQRVLSTADSRQYTINLNGSSVVIDDGTQNPNVSGMLSSLSGFADRLSGLAQNVSEDAAVKVLNLSTADGSAESLRQAVAAAMGFSDANAVQNNGILLNSNQYLIINVNSSAPVTRLPEVKIGGVNPGESWNTVASRVIWNFGSYSGTVHTSANAGTLGTLLAPNAQVIADGSSMNGPVYANEVHHISGGEIHRIPFQAVSSADVYFAAKEEESSSSSESSTTSSGVIVTPSSEASSSETPSEENSSTPSHGNGDSSSESSVSSTFSSSSSQNSSSNSSGTPSKVDSDPNSHGTGSSSESSSSSTPSDSSSQSSSSNSSGTPSKVNSDPNSHGTGSSSESGSSSTPSDSSSQSSSSSSNSTPSKVDSDPNSHGTGSSSESGSSSTPSDSSSQSSSSSSNSTPSKVDSDPNSHGTGSSSESGSSSSSSNSSSSTFSHPYYPPVTPSSDPGSFSTGSSEAPSQESSSTPSNGNGESSSASSETPRAESGSTPSNGAGTVSSANPSADSSIPASNGNSGEAVTNNEKLPQTGADVVPILVTFACGSAVILYGIIEMIHGRAKKKHE